MSTSPPAVRRNTASPPSQIVVPASFHVDFRYYCERTGMDRLDQQHLRDSVRADFAVVGVWVTECAAVYRFCDATWGYVPSAELARGYLASKKWYPADDTIFTRLGPLLLARLCARVAGAI